MKNRYPYHRSNRRNIRKVTGQNTGIRRRTWKWFRRLLLALLVIAMAAGIFHGLFSGESDKGIAKFLSRWNADSEQNAGSDSTEYGEEALVNYDGTIRITVNDNIPGFTEEMLTTRSYERYGKLDSLGRCTSAVACLSEDTMPADGEERGDISEVHPSGWRSGYEWERCHLIAWSLSDENANERNLITGTHDMNEAMKEYEILVAQYIEDTGNHVLYRSTPVFEGDNLIASGVQVEAESVEDTGAGISFNVYFYNVTPGKVIDYSTGVVTDEESKAKTEESQTYVLNTSSRKFHRPDCDGVKDMNDANKRTVKATRTELIEQGYDPCGMCEP